MIKLVKFATMVKEDLEEIPDPPENYTEDDAEEANEKRMSDDGDGWTIE